MRKSILIGITTGVALVSGYFLFSSVSWKPFGTQYCSAPYSYSFQKNQSKIYSINFEDNSNSNWGALFSDSKSKSLTQQEIHFKIKSDWFMSVIDQEGDQFITYNELQHPEIAFEFNHAPDPVKNNELIRQLSKAFYLRVSKTGEISALYTDPTLKLIEKNTIRWLVSHTQVNFSNTSSEKTWISTEFDPNGEYESRYKLSKSTSNQLYIEKNKFQYLSLNFQKKKKTARLQDPLEDHFRIEPKSQVSIQFDCRSGNIASIEGDEKLLSQVGEHQIAQATDHFQIKLKSASFMTEEKSQLLLSDFRNLNLSTGPIRLVADEAAKDMEKLIQQTELGNLTADQLFAMLDRAKKSKDPKDLDALYLKFKALIYLYPDTCSRIERILSTEDPNSRVMGLLATALSTIGSVEAQKSLQGAIEARSENVAALQVLIPALGMTNNPTTQSEDTIRTLIKSSNQEEIVTTAGLSLGIMASHLADESPQRQSQIVESIHRDLETAETPEQKKFLVSVLGNAGSSDSLPQIQEALKSSDSSLQAEAAMALRWIPGQESEDALTRVLSESENEGVRKAAVSALSFRNPSIQLSERLRSIFSTEKSEWIRREIVKNEYELRRVDPQVSTWLKWVKTHDPAESVRKIAKDYESLSTS